MNDRRKQIQKRVTRQVNASDAKVDALMRRIERMLDVTLEDTLTRLELKDKSAANAGYMLRDLEQALKQAGLDRELGRLRAIYADELDHIQDEFSRTTGKDFQITGFDVDNLRALADSRIDLASKSINRYVGNVRDQILITTFGGERPNFKMIAEKFEPAMLANLQTEFNTSIVAYNRTVNKIKAEEAGINLFLYIGPEDDITRRFCLELLRDEPSIYTRDQVENMNNRQDLPVFQYGGGYNCRHHWRAVSDELAKELGYKP